ncbi:MAG: hypothetical protein B6U97_04275, partial [Candidatus Altiarchaeales archaeon ex4484_96]
GVKKKTLDDINRVKMQASKEVDATRAVIDEKTEEAVESIKEKPVEWVAGAFIAGLILGKLLSK